MAKGNVVHFRLDGIDYALRGDMSEERMERIVAMVEEKIADIRSIAPAYSATRTAMLAALHLAEALLDVEEENAQVMAEANMGGQYEYRFSIPKREHQPKEEDK